MRCTKCKSEMEMKRELYHYWESGLDNLWLKNWPILVCPKCKTKLPLLPDPDKTAKEITRALVSQTARLDGDSIVFLRKAMRLTTEALANLLGVDRVTVSRWENNKRNIESGLDFRLRVNAMNRILPEQVRLGTRDALDKILAGDYHPEIAVGDTKIQVAIETPEPPNTEEEPILLDRPAEPDLPAVHETNSGIRGFSTLVPWKRR